MGGGLEKVHFEEKRVRIGDGPLVSLKKNVSKEILMDEFFF